MNRQDGHARLTELPLVVAGPLLRHTTAESVTVWLALKQACIVDLKVHETAGQQIGECILQGTRSTIALGEFLHVVAVTANSGSPLQPDQLYAYDLHFSTPHTQWTLDQALISSRVPVANLSYFAHRKPTFALPPTQIEDLRIVQGSCRKPHGQGADALPLLDHLLETTAHSPRNRPHQLFLTGDQIYGDDVADPMLEVAIALGDLLLGWQEKLPMGPRDRVTYFAAADLEPGTRAEIATKQGGFTAGLRHQRKKATNHLFSFAEYCAAYLLAWSPVGWTLSHSRSQTSDSKSLADFIQTLPEVRRALANIPTYMMFDDHDVSDDWNLNRAWCMRVFGRPLGRQVVQNAMLSYALFQGWGNTPEQFAAGQAGDELLAAVQCWAHSEGRNRDASAAIAQYTGIPPQDLTTGLPRFVLDQDVLILDRHPDALTWHYTIKSPCHEVIVLDTRTWRGYSLKSGTYKVPDAIAPPMLLCPTALKQQVGTPLSRTAPQATFLIAPTNLFGLKVIDWIHHWQLRNKKVFSTDVGDAWNINIDSLAQLLIQIFENRRSLIVLSGDIHCSSTVRLSYQDPAAEAVLVQLTCSALKNEELLTRLIHTRLKEWLLPESVRRWIGWKQPPRMIEQATRSSPIPADWSCTLEWIPRQATQGLNPSRPFWRRLAQWFQDGRESVGINNLAVVSFLPDALTVVHTLYWQQSSKIVYGRYECSLDKR